MIKRIDGTSTAPADKTGELQEIKEVETKEVQSAEAKALEEAKTNENANVDVEIAEEAPKEEKKGFFGKLWDAIKAPFVSDNTEGKVAGGAAGLFGGAGLGMLIAGPVGALIGGAIGLIAGFFGGNAFQQKIEDKNAPEEQPLDENAVKTEETTDEYGNKIAVEYDENGNVVKEKYSSGDVLTYEYDENGNQVKLFHDRDGDGVKNGSDEYYEMEYSDKGQMTKRVYDGSDGRWDTYYEYDENGNTVKISDDNDLDGTPDMTKYLDENGKLTKEETANSSTTFEYHDNGNFAKISYDNNLDGTPDEVKYFNENGNLLEDIKEKE